MRLTFCFSRNCRPYPMIFALRSRPCCPGAKFLFSIPHEGLKQRSPFRNNFIPSLRQSRHTGPMYLANVLSYVFFRPVCDRSLCSHRARLGFSNSSSFWWPATVVWNRRNIPYRPHFKTCSLQGSNSRIASGSWAFHTDFQRAHSGLTRAIGGGEGGLLCCERSSFSRAFKTERTSARPAHDITFHIGYR